ncbi:50S ribosomal protein L3 [Candidatus Uhrbacteria bacterium]|nr:50S ribosomal protein L3 [Candidatus Uhrbacteria bacterium]
MKILLGKKMGMTQQFGPDGSILPVTIIAAGPCVVTQVKTKAADGYGAIQIGYGNKRRLTKAEAGHLKDRGSLRWLREFRIENPELTVGAVVNTEQFSVGENVMIRGTSKGKGFQGVVKRHHFRGHPHTHGHKDQERMPGSIGSRRARGGVIEKGKRMAGHMGDARVSVKNLTILQVDKEKNELWLKGAVPGARNSLVLIQGK